MIRICDVRPSTMEPGVTKR